MYKEAECEILLLHIEKQSEQKLRTQLTNAVSIHDYLIFNIIFLSFLEELTSPVCSQLDLQFHSI